MDKEITVRQACLMRLATWAPARGESKVQLYDLRVNDLGAILQPLADAERLVLLDRGAFGAGPKHEAVMDEAVTLSLTTEQWRLIASAVLATEWPERMAREVEEAVLDLIRSAPKWAEQAEAIEAFDRLPKEKQEAVLALQKPTARGKAK